MKLLGATHLSLKDSEQNNSTVLNPVASGTKNSFGLTQDPKFETKMSKVTEKEKDKEKTSYEIEIEELGRYWIWENYCDDDFKNKYIEEAVELLKHINKAVHQDIEDSYIREGMLPKKDRQNEELKSAAETLKQLKTIDNALKSENMRRPPELWNFPKVV